MTDKTQPSSIELLCPPNSRKETLEIGDTLLCISGVEVYEIPSLETASVFRGLIDSPEHYISTEEIQTLGGPNMNVISRSIRQANMGLLPYTKYEPFKKFRGKGSKDAIKGIQLLTEGLYDETGEQNDLVQLDPVQKTIRVFLMGHAGEKFTIDLIREVVARQHPKLLLGEAEFSATLRSMVELHRRKNAALEGLYINAEKDRDGNFVPVMSWSGNQVRETLKTNASTSTAGAVVVTTEDRKTKLDSFRSR